MKERQKRPFYIIGHNPNTIEEAREYLQQGANGLEPDIVHANGRFYVSHNHQSSYEGVPTVEEYLHALKELVDAGQFNLALIIWDMKDTDFNPTRFMGIVKENFSGGACDGTAMLMTHGDDIDFLNRYSCYYSNTGIGADESNTAPSALQASFTSHGQKNFSYADGITTFLNKPGVLKNIQAAQTCRRLHEPDSFSLVYTWVLSQEASMRHYLDNYIDGIMVDAGSVKVLAGLINQEPYVHAFSLAMNGHNPFTAAPLPSYTLTIRTSNKFLAGTDARFLFTLTGQSGSLTSLPFHAADAGALERSATTVVELEGMDVGTIQSITIEALTGGLTAGWLPASIQVDSKLLDSPVEFIFDNGANAQWITKKGGPVTRHVL